MNEIHLEEYDFIGFASGICFSRFYEKITACVQEKLPIGKQVFFLYTCANNSKDFSENIKQIAIEKGCNVMGTYGCKGFNTYGPFKIVGGINKKHPSQSEIEGAITFFENCIKKAEVKNEISSMLERTKEYQK